MKSTKFILCLILTLILNCVIYCECYITTTPNIYTWHGDTVHIGSDLIVHWLNHTVNWRMSTSGWAAEGLTDLDAVENTLTLAHTEWSSSNVSTTDLSFNRLSRISTVWNGSADGSNTMYMCQAGEQAYNSVPPNYGPLYLNPNAGGITVIKVNSNYELLEADVLQNGGNPNKIWTLTEVRKNGTHEIGHSIGMGDQPTNLPMTMSLYCSGDPSTLEFDDKVGVSFLYGGNLIDNETLSGTNDFNWTINIINGKTLQVNAGSTINFYNNSSLTIINGTLTANGLTGRITFNFIAKNNNGITVNSSGTANISYSDISNAVNGINFNQGTGTIDHCTITNCTNGILVTSATPTIQYCTINNNSYGIKVTSSYSQSWTARNFSNNTITGNTTYGLYLYNSSPTLNYNTINSNNSGTVLWLSCNPIMNHNIMNSNTNYGLACYGSASPNLYRNPNYSFGGNNVIRMNGNKGIVITASSNPNIGNIPANSGGNNSIFDNTGYEIDNLTNNNIYACHNWWGDPPQTGDINVMVNTLYPLSSDPNPLLKMSTFAPSFVYDSTVNIPLAIQQANYEMIYNNYSKASGLLKDYLQKEKFSKFGNMAAVLFLKILDFYLDNKSSINEVELLLNSKLSDDVKYELLSGLSLIYQKVNNNVAAQDCLEKVTEMKLSTEQNNRMLFQKAFLFIYSVQDIDKGKLYLNEIMKNNKENSLDYQLALEELNSLSAFGNNSQPEMSNPKLPDITKVELPMDYKLFNNYPNPFNPSTTIKYALPKESDVQLTVYDIMGKEIKSLISSRQEAGYKEVVWDGTDNNNQMVSSGVYIYRLRAVSTEDLQVFDKSAKLILLK